MWVLVVYWVGKGLLMLEGGSWCAHQIQASLVKVEKSLLMSS